MRLRFWRRAGAFATAAVLSAGLCLGGVFAAEAGNVDVTFTDITSEQGEARKCLDLVNAFRTDPDNQWYWNEDNVTKTETPGLGSLVYDYDLEKVAEQRALEIMVYSDHVRPNGGSCFDVYKEQGYPYSVCAENIAAGGGYYYDSAETVIFGDYGNDHDYDGWTEDNRDYDGQGHRRNILDDRFTNIGLACVYVNDTHYWVMELSATSSPTDTDTNPAGTQTTLSGTVETPVDTVSFSGIEQELTMEAGENMILQVNTNVTQSYVGWSGIPNIVDGRLNMTWSSSDESVAKIEDDTVKAVGTGTATVTGTCNAGTAVYKITVEAVEEPCSHEYGSPEFLWSDDYDSCILVLTCGLCGDRAEVPCDVSKVTKTPTCIEEGYVTATATAEYGGETYTDSEIAATVPTVPHEYYVVWSAETDSDDFNAVEMNCIIAEVFCRVCGKTSGPLTADVETIDEDDDTYTARATVEYDGETFTEVFTLPKGQNFPVSDGHTWAVGFDWTDTHEDMCEVTFACTDEGCGEVYGPFVCDIEDGGRTEPSCTEDGEAIYIASYTFEDIIYTDSRTVTLPATGHIWNDGTILKEPTGTEDGEIEYTCTVCSESYTETIPALGESEPLPDEPDEDENEWVVYYHWDDEEPLMWVAFYRESDSEFCGWYEADVIRAGEYDEPADCTHGDYEGWAGYFVYADSEGEDQWFYSIALYEVSDPVGHTYGEPVFVWNYDSMTAKAVFTCSVCGHEEIVSCTVDRKVTSEPDCTHEGRAVYTATAEFEGGTYTTDEIRVISALGHEWKPTAVFHWNEDYTVCMATLTCERCDESEEFECDVSESGEVMVATLTVDGLFYTDEVSVESGPAEPDDQSPDSSEGMHEELVEELEAELDIAEGIDESLYTEESVKALEEAVEHAKTVLADEDATDEEIAEAIAELEEMIANLVPVEEEKQSDSQPGGSDNGGSAGLSVNGNGGSNSSGAVSTDSGVSTGSGIASVTGTSAGSNEGSGGNGNSNSGTVAGSGVSSDGTVSTAGAKTGGVFEWISGAIALISACGLVVTIKRRPIIR